MIGLLVLFILCIFSPLHGKKVAVLEEAMKPWDMVIDNGQLFVADKKVIHIYKLPDFKWVKTFGKAGEGPGEFKTRPYLTPYPEYLLINSEGKVMYFSRQGEFLREKRIDYWLNAVYPAGNRFFSTKTRIDRKLDKRFKDFVLLDDSFKTAKVFFSWERPSYRESEARRIVKFMRPLIFSQAYQDKFFIGDNGKGFYIGVYNAEGDQEYVFNRKYRKRRVTDKYKSRHLKELKKNKSYQRYYQGMTFDYPDYFPAYRYFEILDGRIFVHLYRADGKKGDFVLLDLKGNLLKEGRIKPDAMFTLYKDKIYYFVDNEETEEWELIEEDL